MRVADQSLKPSKSQNIMTYFLHSNNILVSAKAESAKQWVIIFWDLAAFGLELEIYRPTCG